MGRAAGGAEPDVQPIIQLRRQSCQGTRPQVPREGLPADGNKALRSHGNTRPFYRKQMLPQERHGQAIHNGSALQTDLKQSESDNQLSSQDRSKLLNYNPWPPLNPPPSPPPLPAPTPLLVRSDSPSLLLQQDDPDRSTNGATPNFAEPYFEPLPPQNPSQWAKQSRNTRPVIRPSQQHQIPQEQPQAANGQLVPAVMAAEPAETAAAEAGAARGAAKDAATEVTPRSRPVSGTLRALRTAQEGMRRRFQ